MEILEIFTTAFLLKIYLNLVLFQVLQRALLKNEKKYLLKKDVSHLKIADIARDIENIEARNIEKREGKTKNEKRSATLNIFFYFKSFM